MAIVKIYRLQHVATECGLYHTHSFTLGVENLGALVKHNVDVVRQFMRDCESDRHPTALEDYKETFKSHPLDDEENQDTTKPYKKFFKFKYCDLTKYGCHSIEQLFNQWLCGDSSIITPLELGLYQLLEVSVDEKDCFLLKNQIMYNSLDVIATEILDIRESFEATLY